ncbi:di-heme oxidoreductase family protein [Denitromonas iodatirespirans]|uniref:Thiol oxidoreductase n=1 Tax=Denitromonas iodatirespirans TaxID=2795389 RepID=A0A944HAR4_DENI1|nr:di-heme oxidoredictase family protein [Denitromonas iodatirespirans]MBT0960877.1 thiol oxidoreductase [Denitromonas iodatirespirans]
MTPFFKPLAFGLLIAGSAALVATAADGTDPANALPGGDTTTPDHGRNAFSNPAANLDVDRQTPFFIGNSFFKKNWVAAPASTTGRDGLGPHFIARACASCHLLDGRGAPPPAPEGVNTEQPVGLLLRLSIPGDGGRAGVVPEPTYGGQFNNQAVDTVQPEGRVTIRYTEQPGRFADGTPYSLRKPSYEMTDLAYGPLHPDTRVSPRVAPQVIGLGLLEAIPEADLRAIAERQARKGAGISGRPNRVWDAVRQDWVIGRFGWKANVGTVAHQTAGAFNGDIGVTSPLFPHEECMAAQADCQARQQQESQWRQGRGEPATDIDARALERTIYYTTTLAVPSRRQPDAPEVRHGEALFHAAQCASCHVPRHVTGKLEGFPELSGQTITPYTDLLLHDMGEGLADNRSDFAADGREWRTPPLWGIGLIPTVNGHSMLLHDGRARNILEAILWHGGEAEGARAQVLRMSRAERDALVRFVGSL